MLVLALDTTAKTASCAVLEKDAEGYYIPRFYITDVVWDATGGSLTYNPKK